MKTNFKPINPLVQALLTDSYQPTMIYAQWKAGRHNIPAVFEMFYRQNPFVKKPSDGGFVVHAGLEDVLRYVNGFTIAAEDMDFIKDAVLPAKEPEFYKWLKTLNFSKTDIYAPKEGTVLFPRVPMFRVEGPLAAGHIFETCALNQTSFASLIATNALRHRLEAGPNKALLEFGLRGAQGPDGAISAAKYAYMGGFDATSNVLAGKIHGIPVQGTMAHSFIQSFEPLDLSRIPRVLQDANGKEHDFVAMVLEIREELGFTRTNDGELAAFIVFAQAFPTKFLALVDTYNTIKSGVPNFICVAIALAKLGYKPIGVRLDSGDLADLSKQVRRVYETAGQRHGFDFFKLTIFASNDITEEILEKFNIQGNEINGYGIGRRLVTCSNESVLGVVYKLVDIEGIPKIKLSEDGGKITIPGRKNAHRLYGSDGKPLRDLLVLTDDDVVPEAGEKVLCRDPFVESGKVIVKPNKVVPLLDKVWAQGKVAAKLPKLGDIRQYVLEQGADIPKERRRFLNPTPYKASVSSKLYDLIHELLAKEVPIPEIE